jgi:hypothetical protein
VRIASLIKKLNVWYWYWKIYQDNSFFIFVTISG